MPELDPSSTTEPDLEDLVPRTKLVDIRLQRIDGEVVSTAAEALDVAYSNKEPKFTRQENKILVLFQDRLDYTSQSEEPEGEAGEPVGHVEVNHIVEIELLGEGEPTDESISHFVSGNIVFMAYPYIRAAMHRVPTELGLPPVTLPYLHRSDAALPPGNE